MYNHNYSCTLGTIFLLIGLYREVKKWTIPLRSLPQLHSVFLDFAKENYDDLDELSKKVSDMNYNVMNKI